jgi:cysteine desulfuration protein SufE
VTAATLHPRLQEIADDFNAVMGQDRLQLLLEFSQELPPLPARYADQHDLLEPVPECQTPLFLAAEVEPDGLDGLNADEVLATPAEFTSQLGLQDLVSPLRLRGMAAMLGRIKRQVRDQRG